MTKQNKKRPAAEVLADWMEKNRYTTPQFGKAVGLSRTSVFRILNGERMPSFDAMTRIKKFTGGAVDYEHWAVKS